MKPTFCTAINCLDGRTQAPVIRFLRDKFAVEYVDMVTEAGPVGALAQKPNGDIAQGIYRRVKISMDAHGSTKIAVVAHHDCAGNPVPKAEQLKQLRSAMASLAERYPDCEVRGLWVDATGEVSSR